VKDGKEEMTDGQVNCHVTTDLERQQTNNVNEHTSTATSQQQWEHCRWWPNSACLLRVCYVHGTGIPEDTAFRLQSVLVCGWYTRSL